MWLCCFTLINFIRLSITVQTLSEGETTVKRESSDKERIMNIAEKSDVKLAIFFRHDSMLTAFNSLHVICDSDSVTPKIISKTFPHAKTCFFSARVKMQLIHKIGIFVLIISSLAEFSASEPRVVCYYTNWSVYRPVSSLQL